MNESINTTGNQENTLGQQKISFNMLIEQPDYLKETQSFNNKIYYIKKYSDNSEKHTHIKKIIPLHMTPFKRTLYIFLNIITCGIINLFMKWFPSLKVYLRYNVTNLLKAKYIGIYGMDGEMNIKKLKKIKFPAVKLDGDNIIANLGLNIKSIKYALMFDYKSYDYIYNENTDEFEVLDYRIKCPKSKILNKLSKGLYPNEVEFLQLIFGKCDIDIQLTSFKKILLNELSDPFYLFQLYSIILWILTEYYLYSLIIIILTLISLIISLRETYSNLKKIEKLSKYSCPVNIYRKNSLGETIIYTISSLELVPGDLFEVPDEGVTLPCDSILVRGSVVINESMLTGESTPIIKSCLENSEEIYDSKLIDNNSKYILYSGTKILQKKYTNKNEKILAMVCDTGFRTFKGSMLSSVIFPKDEDEDFRRDSLKYIIFMVIICFIGYFASLKSLIEAKISEKELLLRFFELFTSAVPPSLPTCLSLGMSYSLYRLKKYNIFCINRERITLLGTINTIVFDKTGTLTENLLDIKGFIPNSINKRLNSFEFKDFCHDLKEYSNIIKEYLIVKKDSKLYNNKNKDMLKLYLECMATCHCLSIINNKLIGDPIDVKMFENTGWALDDKQNELENIIDNGSSQNKKIIFSVKPKKNKELNFYNLEVFKRFDFMSNLQRMSVIAKDANEEHFKIFCKGSPEKLKKLCLNETIPSNFNKILDLYAAKGYRILALACRFIKIDNFEKIDSIQREKIEKNMIFLGFLIVTNKLKPESKSTIATLDTADLRMMMATGDNILTAISVSKECDIVKKNQEIYSLQLEKDDNNIECLAWEQVSNDNNKNKKYSEYEFDNSSNNLNDILEDKGLLSIYPPLTLSDRIFPEENDEKPISEPNEANTITTKSISRRQSICFDPDDEQEKEIKFIEDNSPMKISTNDNFAIALTGETFNKLFELNQKYLLLKKNYLLKAHKTFRLILKNGAVFARMNPQDKALLVESLKGEGLNPLMCGDGSNDCLALRKANVGVSLSVEEASIAAHFTSLHPGINCLIHLLKEGKCSLAASIQVFKFVILDSMIQFISVTLIMIYNSYFSDFQFLLGDIGISFPVVTFYLMTNPASKLTHKYPLTGILTFPVLVSVISQMSFTFFFQFFGNLFLKNIYKWETDCGFIKGTIIPLECEENTILFIISHFQFISCAIAFCTSKPFRQRIYKMPIQVIYYLVLILYSIWFTINCDRFSREVFMLYDFESNEKRYKNNSNVKMFKYILFIIVVANSAINIIFERFIVKFVEIFWSKNQIKKYKKDISKAKGNNLLNNEEYNEEPLFKYQDIYFYDRRHNEEQRKKNIKNNETDVSGINFIELVGTNDKNENILNNNEKPIDNGNK